MAILIACSVQDALCMLPTGYSVSKIKLSILQLLKDCLEIALQYDASIFSVGFQVRGNVSIFQIFRYITDLCGQMHI